MREGEIVAGRFEVVRLSGSGGMGRVYEARDLFSGATVALKVLHERLAEGGSRFRREAELLAGLRHPAVVRYVAHGETNDGRLYLAMEWLEGETLHARLREGPLS